MKRRLTEAELTVEGAVRIDFDTHEYFIFLTGRGQYIGKNNAEFVHAAPCWDRSLLSRLRQYLRRVKEQHIVADYPYEGDM